MRIRTFRRHLREGFKSLIRNGWMTFASVSTVTVTLLLTGVFLMVLLNMNSIASQIEDDVEVRVYIDRSANEEQVEALKQQIEQIPEVDSIEFVSRDEGLENLIESLGDEGQAFESLKDENPLQDMYVVKTKVPRDTVTVAERVETYDFAEEVRYGKGTVERLFNVIEVSRNIGIVLIVGLVFTALFLIANTIKLTILSRRREIEIMKLVGATNSFIRWPFFIEGLLLGLIGSIVPIVILIVGYNFIYNEFNARLSTMFIELLPVYPFVIQLTLILLFIGVFIGVWGSLTSVRKFLRV